MVVLNTNVSRQSYVTYCRETETAEARRHERETDVTAATLRAGLHSVAFLADADECGERAAYLDREREWAKFDRTLNYYRLNSPSCQPPDGPAMFGPLPYGRSFGGLPKDHSPKSEQAYVNTFHAQTALLVSVIPAPCTDQERVAILADVVSELNAIRCNYEAGTIAAENALAQQTAVFEILSEHGPIEAAARLRERHRRPEPTPEEAEEAETLAREAAMHPRKIFESGLPWKVAEELSDRQITLAGGDTAAPLRPEIITDINAAITAHRRHRGNHARRPWELLRNDPPPAASPVKPPPPDTAVHDRDSTTTPPAQAPDRPAIAGSGDAPPPVPHGNGNKSESPCQSTERLAIAVSAAQIPGEPQSDLAAKLARCIISASDYVANEPPPMDPVIEGLFELGDKFGLLAPPKMKKTFFLTQAAISIATGSDFLGFRIPKRRRVLFINMEIKAAHMHRRIRSMAQILNVRPDALEEYLYICNARGLGLSGKQLISFVCGAAKGLVDVVIVDPLYKLIEGDENSAKDVKLILSAFDELAENTGVAVIYAHHDAKGTPGDRDIRDRGAGTNAISRDYDCGITLTRHLSEADATVVHFLPRNFIELEPVVVRFEDGRFTLASGLLPDVATSRTRKTQGSAQGDSWRAHLPEAVEIVLSRVWLKGDLERELHRRFKLSGPQSKKLFQAVRDDGRVYCDRGPNKGTTPQHFMGAESDVLAEIDRLKR